MSDFNLSAPYGANKKKRIVGRGSSSGRGSTAGKGNKGQQSRSGGKVYVGFEGGQMPLYRRIARRGFSNYWFKKEFAIVNLRDLEARFADGETVNNVDAFEQVVRIMHDSDIGYGAINHPVDRDPVCGYVGVIKDVCPRCGRREGEGVEMEKVNCYDCREC